MTTASSSDPTPSSSRSSSASELSDLGRCGSCLGTGLRPRTGVWVVLGSLSISWDGQPISRADAARWKKRFAAALAGLVTVVGGWYTSTYGLPLHP
jgi:hypothetical protein